MTIKKTKTVELTKIGSQLIPNFLLRLAIFLPIRKDFKIIEKKTWYNGTKINFEGYQLNFTDLKMIGLISKVYEQNKHLTCSKSQSFNIELTKEDICAFQGWKVSDYNQNRKELVAQSLRRLKQIEITIPDKVYDTTYSIYNKRHHHNTNDSIILELNKFCLSPSCSEKELKYEGTFIDLLYRKFYSSKGKKEYYDYSYLCFDSLNEINIATPALLFAFLSTHNMNKAFAFSKCQKVTNSFYKKDSANKRKIVKALDFLKSLNMIADYSISDNLKEWLTVVMPKKDSELIEGEIITKSKNTLSDKSLNRKLNNINNQINKSTPQKEKERQSSRTTIVIKKKTLKKVADNLSSFDL